ncbi:MAG: hypothetical protein GXO75_01770 [Calditrichaeota bacterium]|nr:hypothetical protein [Calditrichota bacterium]
MILAFAVCLVNVDIFHFRPGPKELMASEAESWYYIGRAEGDRAKNEKGYQSQIKAYKKAITTMQKSVAIDSVFSSPLTFMGIYKIKIAKNLMRNFEADTTSFIKSEISIANEAMQNLGDAKKLLELAHHIAPQFASPLYNLCLTLYFRNIIEFTFYGEHNKAVKMNIAKRCDEINRITDELLQSKQFEKYKDYYRIKRKARLQQQVVSGK